MGNGQTSWTPAQLYERLMNRETFQILDIRTTGEFASWQIEGRAPIPVVNIPYIDFLDLDETEDVVEAALRGLPEGVEPKLAPGLPVLAVCPHGNTSGYVAEALRQRGREAANLEGGMAAWGAYYHGSPVTDSEQYRLFQISRPARGCLSHVLISQGEAVVIDPGRHIGEYSALVEREQARLVAVLDTHMHADHISGGVQLAESSAVDYHLHPYDAIHPMDMLPARFSYRYLKDGQRLRIGSVELKVVAIPGHTIGQVAFLAGNHLFAGDSIFVRSIARPDLGGKPDQWTPLFYRSLRSLLELPDDTWVLPAHFSTLTELDDDGICRDTIGHLREHNPGLRMAMETEEVFARYIKASLPRFPEAYIDIKRVNAGLMEADEAKAEELELGKNVCALEG